MDRWMGMDGWMDGRMDGWMDGWWKSKRFNEMCVLGGGEISGSRCDVASSWCLSCLCFLQLMVYREFFMDTMQMVVAIPLCFGSFVHHLWLALLRKIHTNTDEYWVDVITSAYRERPA